MPIKKSELYSSLWQSCDELRGGMDASQYKDYVLVLLFVKYVSDKADSQKNYLLTVPKGGRFADMVALKGSKDIYGQEMDNATKALARMNMILHDCLTAEIEQDNSLSTPHFKDPKTGGLMTFDFVVANPPFSSKAWSSGVNVDADPFKRFDLVKASDWSEKNPTHVAPPQKNGDYAFLLHILACLKSTGFLPRPAAGRDLPRARGRSARGPAERGHPQGLRQRYADPDQRVPGPLDAVEFRRAAR